jgi:enoyl-CoA hydratase/carnithine racemase
MNAATGTPMAASPPAPLVSLEIRGHIGIIFLQDQARRNALSAALISGILDALEQSRAQGARAVVLCSATGNFCAGADIREMLNSGWLTAQEPDPSSPTPLDLFKAIEFDPRVIIAAVEGMVLGGGVELSLVCDMVVATDDATFLLPEIGLGVIPNTAMARLPALVGLRIAKELILTRRRLSAVEAKDLGLVNRVVPKTGLLDQALALAASVVDSAPPGAITAVKAGMAPGAHWSDVTALLGTMNSREWAEGFNAFLGKRKPDYEQFWAHR